MLPRFAWLPRGILLLASLGGCRALLEGDEVTFEGTTGTSAGGGTSTGTGAGGAGTTDAVTSTTGTGGATSSSSSVSSGQGGFSVDPPCTTDQPANCMLPANADELHQFEQTCPHGAWCYYPSTVGSNLDQASGSLQIESEGMPNGTGWWDVASVPFAPYLFRTTTDGNDFVVVTRVTVSGTMLSNPGASSGYKVAGLVLREANSLPAHATERFFKLEYGYLGASPLGGNDFGFLWAQRDGVAGISNHISTVMTPGTNEPEVGLAACRLDSGLEFFMAQQNGWAPVPNEPDPDLTLLDWPVTFSIGLMTGTFNPGGGVTVGTFDYAGIRTGNALASETSCLEAVQNLEMDLIAARAN